MGTNHVGHRRAFAAVAVIALAASALPALTSVASAAAVPTFAAGSATVVEGDSGTRIAYVPITLSDPATTQVSVGYTVTPGSAAAGTDFRTRSGTSTFKLRGNGPTSVATFVAVTIYPDTTLEGDETFVVTLANATGGAAIGGATGIGTIRDDDTSSGLRVSTGSAQIYEGDSGPARPAKISVTLSEAANAPVAVGYTLTAVTATPGTDIKTRSGTLVFNPSPSTGRTPVKKAVSALVYPDPIAEGSETAVLTLTSVSGGSGAVLNYDVGTVTIVNDDAVTPDSDGDRLPNSVETDTGVFVGTGNTGTDPFNADTDGDGIDDGDEVLGTLAGLALPNLGTSPLKQNLLLEFDWFDDANDCAAHSHQPTATAINGFEAAFANAPISNPDGTTGIDVISDYGQGGAFTGGNLIADADGVIAGGVFNTDYVNDKAANFAASRNGYFHYVLNPHRYNTNSGSSGQASIFGDDMIVSLNCANSNTNVRNTIMHELGHNLNLRHGGNVDTNYKPNYNSVMNYLYQFPGVDTNCTPPGDGLLDYSHGTRISLNENSLNETLGTCGSGFPWDWNGNAVVETNVVFNLNPLFDAALTTLTDSNDWANVAFGGVGGAGAGNRTIAPEVVSEQPVPLAFR